MLRKVYKERHVMQSLFMQAIFLSSPLMRKLCSINSPWHPAVNSLDNFTLRVFSHNNVFFLLLSPSVRSVKSCHHMLNSQKPDHLPDAHSPEGWRWKVTVTQEAGLISSLEGLFWTLLGYTRKKNKVVNQCHSFLTSLTQDHYIVYYCA